MEYILLEEQKMPDLVWLIIGGAAVAVVLWKFTGISLDGRIAKALKGGDVEDLLTVLQGLSQEKQPTAYNRAIRRIWDAYERPLAIPLIRALVENHQEESIAQYWLQQLHTVEPDLAQETMDQEFLETYYKAHVAATCGDAG